MENKYSEKNESSKLVQKLMNSIACSTTVENLRQSETPCSMMGLFDTKASKM